MSLKMICITKNYHGKLWKVGAVTTDAELKKLGGYVPKKHFTTEGTKEAFEISPEAEKERSTLRNLLIAKSKIPHNSATLEQLRAMVEKMQTPAPSIPSGPQGLKVGNEPDPLT